MDALKVIWEVIQVVLTWPVKVYIGIINAIEVPDFWQITIAIGILLSIAGIAIYKHKK